MLDIILTDFGNVRGRVGHSHFLSGKLKVVFTYQKFEGLGHSCHRSGKKSCIIIKSSPDRWRGVW